LDNPGTEVITKEFSIAGHAWQLELKHLENGNLSAYANCKSHSSLMAHLFFTVIHNVDSSKNKCSGCVSKFTPDSGCWGFTRLASTAEIKAKGSGYLVGDSFTVKLELRLKVPENELFFASADRTSAQCTWKLKGLDKSRHMKLRSDIFNFGGSEWRLFLERHSKSPVENDMSFFLHYYGHEVIQVKNCTVLVVNQCHENHISRGFSYQFEREEGYGFPSLLSAEALENEALGFLMDGWITLTVLISIDSPQNPSNPRSVQPQLQQLIESEKGPECVICLDKVQTSGVLHGNTTHKCYCTDCAEDLQRQRKQLNCPICGVKVDLIVKMF